MTDDFFRNRMPWQEIEASLTQCWARQVKAGKKIEDLNLFDPVSAVAGGGISNAGRPRSAHPVDGGLAVPQACVQRERRGRDSALKPKKSSWHLKSDKIRCESWV